MFVMVFYIPAIGNHEWARTDLHDNGIENPSDDEVSDYSFAMQVQFGIVVFLFFAVLVRVLTVLAELGDEIHRTHDRLDTALVARTSNALLGGGGELAALLSRTESQQSWDLLRSPVDSRLGVSAIASIVTAVLLTLVPTLL